MEEWQIPTTEQFSTMRNAWVLAGQQAEELQKRAILLGYNVVHSVAIEGGTGAGPEVSFSVWRWDQDRNADRQEFSSVPEVEAHLEQLAALPAYRLDLVGNPTIREITDDGIPFSEITDPATGQRFLLRKLDMEAVTSLVIHSANGAPTVGNWRLDDSPSS